MDSTQKLVVDENELEDFTFENNEIQSEQNENTDIIKTEKVYTKIDGLENDKEIIGARNVIISMISPENILNCNTWGIKVKGFEDDDTKTEEKAELMRKLDKHFDVFVGLNGHWHPMNPTTTQIENEKYKNKDLNKIMKKIHESEKKDMRDKFKKSEETEDNENDEEEKILKELLSKRKVESDSDSDSNNDTNETTEYIYSNVDTLDEDRIIPDQRYAVISFASPEIVHNVKDYYFKVRGYSHSVQKAFSIAKQLEEKDKMFKIMVIPIGKWVAINFNRLRKMKIYSDSDQIEKQKFDLNILNEIVGRYKKNLDDRKEIIKKRKEELIKEGANEAAANKENENNENIDDKEVKEQISKELGKNKEATKERLRNLINNNSKLKENMDKLPSDESKQEKVLEKNSEMEMSRRTIKGEKKRDKAEKNYMNNLDRNKYATMERIRKKLAEKQKENPDDFNQKKVKISQESLRLNEKRQNIDELKANKEKLEENLKRMKEMLAKRNNNNNTTLDK